MYKKGFLQILLLSLLFIMFACEQKPTTQSGNSLKSDEVVVFGKVTSSDYKLPIPGATVALFSQSAPGVVTTTDDSGRYSIKTGGFNDKVEEGLIFAYKEGVGESDTIKVILYPGVMPTDPVNLVLHTGNVTRKQSGPPG